MGDWSAIHSSKDQGWRTPLRLFDALYLEFRFELDAAATAESSLCLDYFGPDHHDPKRRDALAADWPAVPIWLNPPYGRGVGAWLERAHQASRQGATVACLVMSCTDTAWFHDWARLADEIRLLRGRVRFLKSDTGAPAAAAPKGSALVIFRPHVPVDGWAGGPRFVFWDQP